ncbi:MAG: hypothetical protein ACT4O1_11255 [Gemmatimonadota bacterium]
MSEEFDKEWEERLNSYASELPMEKTPSPLLEERTVRQLRKRGLLRKTRSLPIAWLVGSIAASLALLATGVVIGQYLGTRNTVQAIAQIQNRGDAAAAAAHVQQTGTAYVQALEALVSAAHQNQNGQVNPQAREVALTALHEAANEVVRLAPNDPVVAKILQGIEQEKKQSQTGNARTQRQIVWF